MAKEGTAKSGIHSNRKKPLLHDFSLKEGEITIFRVSKARGQLQFFVMKGKFLIDLTHSLEPLESLI